MGTRLRRRKWGLVECFLHYKSRKWRYRDPAFAARTVEIVYYDTWDYRPGGLTTGRYELWLKNKRGPAAGSVIMKGDLLIDVAAIAATLISASTEERQRLYIESKRRLTEEREAHAGGVYQQFIGKYGGWPVNAGACNYDGRKQREEPERERTD